MGIDRARLARLIAEQKQRFVDAHPRSRAAFERARGSLLGGVPMNWMDRWAGGFPVVLDHAEGARATDIDGITYVDFCLGDTGAMAGHAPAPTLRALEAQARRGITAMLPSEDAAWVGEELARRFGLPKWQFTLTATDANRFTIRLARAITGRPKILAFNWCYHGSVDETIATLDDHGVQQMRPGNVLSMAAARATLSEVLTAEAYGRMIPLAGQFAAGVDAVIEATGVPWHIVRLGARAEYGFTERPPRNGGEAAAAWDRELDEYMHLNAMNSGLLMTPFHNMALMSPATTGADVDRHTEAFEEGVRRLLGG